MPFASRTDVRPAHHLAVLLLPEGCERAQFRASLVERGIQTSVHYPPIHRFRAHRTFAARRLLPRTEAVAERLVTLPLFPHMSNDQVWAVTDAVASAAQGAT